MANSKWLNTKFFVVALQTEVSGMPWPAFVGVVACHEGYQDMPWPALVGAATFHGLLPWWALWKGVVACPWALQTEVSGVACHGLPWGVVACHGRPWGVPRHALVCAMGVPWHAMACLGGCHGMP
jgi:hypothetical protein